MMNDKNNTVVYCRGDKSDEDFDHPLIYLYKEKDDEIFCPYCNKLMNEKI